MDVEFVNPNSCKGIKLLEHTFKLYEKILDGLLREVVDIDKMQYGFMPEPKIRSCFLYLLTWKRLLIGCQEKLFVLL